jgi:hypothetical protein
MARLFAVLTCTTLIVVLVSAGYAQQASETDSVADAAREQKRSKSEQKKSAKKVYTNAEVAPSGAVPEKGAQANPSSADGGQRSAVKSTKAQDPDVSRTSIFDRSKQASPETIVVPAGTKITVDISEENPPRNVPLRLHVGKVVNIVQVGSTVVIPALSKVTIQDSVGAMELIDVTIDGVRYGLQTDRVPLQEGSMSEGTFTVTREFTINR